MVAYSFQNQFVAPITVGLGRPWINQFGVAVPDIKPKRHTIRADRKRHARPGGDLQLYHGMRTKACFLIGRARCTAVNRIELVFRGDRCGVWIDGAQIASSLRARNHFASSDGFDNWAALAAFWKENHADPETWEGVIIHWEPLS